MWQYELVGMAAAIWPALFCLIAPPRADPSEELQGTHADRPDSPQAKSETFLPKETSLEWPAQTLFNLFSFPVGTQEIDNFENVEAVHH